MVHVNMRTGGLFAATVLVGGTNRVLTTEPENRRLRVNA